MDWPDQSYIACYGPVSPNEVCIGVAVSVKNICAGFITVSVKSYCIIGQEVYYSIGRFYYIIGQLLHYRAFFITLSGTYYSIGRLLHYRLVQLSFSRLECGVHGKLHISNADWWDILLPLA